MRQEDITKLTNIMGTMTEYDMLRYFIKEKEVKGQKYLMFGVLLEEQSQSELYKVSKVLLSQDEINELLDYKR